MVVVVVVCYCWREKRLCHGDTHMQRWCCCTSVIPKCHIRVFFPNPLFDIICFALPCTIRIASSLFFIITVSKKMTFVILLLFQEISILEFGFAHLRIHRIQPFLEFLLTTACQCVYTTNRDLAVFRLELYKLKRDRIRKYNSRL